MRARLLVVATQAVAVAAVALAPTAHAAKTTVLDGKKVKKVVNLMQTPMSALPGVEPTDAQAAACKAPAECDRLPFVYKPARGIKGKGALTVSTWWYFPTSTVVDLYLVSGTKVVHKCTGVVGNKRFIQVPAHNLKYGKTYTAIAYFVHSTGEGLTLQVDMPNHDVAPVVHEDQYNNRIAYCQTSN